MKTTTNPTTEPSTQKAFEGIITIDDIYPFYRMEQGDLDDDIYNQVENNKKKVINGILERLNRSLDEIQQLWPEATKLQLYIAFDKSHNDPNQLVNDIEDKQFQDFIKDTANELIEQINSQKKNKSSENATIHSSMFGGSVDQNNENVNEEEEIEEVKDDDDDSDFESSYGPARRWNLRRSSRTSQKNTQQEDEENEEELQAADTNNSNENQQNKQDSDGEFEDESDESDGDFVYHYKGPLLTHKQTMKNKKKGQGKKSAENSKATKRKTHKEQENIDLPRPKEINKAEWETWSFAHKQSYLKGAKNANAYFYRNLRQGEKARNGKWTPEETKLFLNRIKVMSKKNFYDSNPQWGIFSMAIPGRVGYQCANYYRNLVLEGKIDDPRYKVIDGKLKYIAFHQKENKRSKTRSRSKNDSDSDNYDNSGDINDETKNLSIYERYARENPLIGAIDGITREQIRVPAISPDGYLLDYKTWLKIISETGCDPYTTKHLTKRSLVVLNYDNIDEYRDKIKNLVIES